MGKIFPTPIITDQGTGFEKFEKSLSEIKADLALTKNVLGYTPKSIHMLK